MHISAINDLMPINPSYSVEQHPSLIPVASTVIGVINATDERIGEQVSHALTKRQEISSCAKY